MSKIGKSPLEREGGAEWRACWEAGMTAREAAIHVGRPKSSGAYTWARRRGVKWPRDTGQRVTDGKRTWPNGVAASKDLGVAPNVVSYHLNRHGHLGRIGKRGPTKGHKPGNPVKIGALSFPTQAKAAQFLGMTENYLSRLIRNGRQDLLLARVLTVTAQREAEARTARSREQAKIDRDLGIRDPRSDYGRNRQEAAA